MNTNYIILVYYVYKIMYLLASTLMDGMLITYCRHN